MQRLIVAFGLIAFLMGCSPRPCVVSFSVPCPGANPDVVVETIAAPIEQQINGAPGMLRIESESHPGRYQCWVFFERTEQEDALAEIQKRIALAQPMLPENTRQTEIIPIAAEKVNLHQEVTLCLVDRSESPEELAKLAKSVLIKAQEQEVLIKLAAVPGPDVPTYTAIVDRQRCLDLGVSLADIEAVAGPSDSPEELAQRKVISSSGKEALFKDIAKIVKTDHPPLLYRLNLSPAHRIEGDIPQGKSRQQVVARLMEIVEEELAKTESTGKIHAEVLPPPGR